MAGMDMMMFSFNSNLESIATPSLLGQRAESAAEAAGGSCIHAGSDTYGQSIVTEGHSLMWDGGAETRSKFL